MKIIKLFIVAASISGALLSNFTYADQAKQQETTTKMAVAQNNQAANAATVNINSADAATLADRLNGIGLKKAEAIVSFREKNGSFKSVDDLVNVPGIGTATLEKNRNIISLN